RGGQGEVDAHDLVAGVDRTGGRNRRVDAAAHRCQYAHHETFPPGAETRPAARARSTTSTMTWATASTAASVVVWESENRSDERASARSRPMAISTWLAWATPAVHADPVEHSMPLASRSISNESPSHPAKDTCTLPGSRASASAPLRTVPSTPS